jgi:hypothetical protein
MPELNVRVDMSRMERISMPSLNRCLPLPRMIGKTNSWYSSTRSWSISPATRSALPSTRMSRPALAFSAATSAKTSPLSRCELFQSTSVSVFDTTYLGRAFIRFVKSSSIAVGQKAAQIW